jgi:hypothetical protein
MGRHVDPFGGVGGETRYTGQQSNKTEAEW